MEHFWLVRRTCTKAVLLAGSLIAFAILSACSDGNTESPSAAEGPTLLLASFSNLTEIRPDGERTVVAAAGAGHFVRYPALSRDGSMIAFSRQIPARSGPNGVVDIGADIYVVPRAGGTPEEALRHSAPGEFLGSPIWLDSSTLLYSARRLNSANQPELFVGKLDLKSGVTSRLLSDAAEPSLSADGKELVFVSLENDLNGTELGISNVDGSNRRMLVSGTEAKFGILSPVFSPEGKRIAFASLQKEALLEIRSSTGNAHPSTHDIWIVNRDGSGLAVFADIAEINPSLTWAGDGRHLYILGQSGIWQVDADGTNIKRIAPGISNSQIIWVPPAQN